MANANSSDKDIIDLTNILKSLKQNPKLPLSIFNYRGTCHSTEGWSICNAMFYSLTVITTIGFGNRSPKTFLGKMLTIPYALVGFSLISVFMPAAIKRAKACAASLAKDTGLADSDSSSREGEEGTRKGNDTSSKVKKDHKDRTKSCKENIRFKGYKLTREKSTSSPSNESIHSLKICDHTQVNSLDPNRAMYAKISTRSRIVFFSTFVILWLILPGFIFSYIENWDFFSGLYFVFITISTIGFGDYTPNFDRIEDFRKYVYIYGVCVWILFSLFGMAYWIGVANCWMAERAEKRLRRVRKEENSEDTQSDKLDSSK